MPKPKGPTRADLAALERAQMKAYEAWDAARPATREKRAREALAISPLCADAHVILAGLAPDGSEERLAAWEAGVAAGAAALGPKAFSDLEGEFWGWHETRPYMRARLGLAQDLLARGRRPEALAHLRDLLRLNPNDNQGVRYILAGLLGELGEDAELAALLDRYAEEDSAQLSWPRALLAFRTGGDNAASRVALAEAEASNPHVRGLLTGATSMPKRLPGYYSPGAESEAVVYLIHGAAAWRATPGALDWLAPVPAAPRRAPRRTTKGD